MKSVILLDFAGDLEMSGSGGASGFIFSQTWEDDQTKKSLFSYDRKFNQSNPTQTFTNSDCGTCSNSINIKNVNPEIVRPVIFLMKTIHLIVLLQVVNIM